MQFKSSFDKGFISQTAKEQYRQFTEFEVRMRPYMDKYVYPELGWKIHRTPERGNIHRDLIANDGKESFDVEEKFRTSVYGDFAVELLQDADYRKPFANEQIGWFYTSTSRYISYIFANGLQATVPKKVYLVDMIMLRAQFKYLIKDGFNHKVITSTKGKGLSFCVGFDWEDLAIAKIATRII